MSCLRMSTMVMGRGPAATSGLPATGELALEISPPQGLVSIAQEQLALGSTVHLVAHVANGQAAHEELRASRAVEEQGIDGRALDGGARGDDTVAHQEQGVA